MRHIIPSLLSRSLITCTAVAALCVMFDGTANAAATIAAAKPLYAWKTENAKDDKTGALKHCLVKNAFDNGTLLLLAENHEGLQRLAIHFPEDVLQQGALVDLALQVDKQDVFPVEGMTSSPRILAMNIPEALPDQLRKGSVLHIRGPEDEIAYQLQGTDKAVQALRDCVTSHKNPSLTRTKLAAISAADADVFAQKHGKQVTPAEMLEPLKTPVSANDLQKNLGIDASEMHLTTPADKAATTSATAMPAVPVAPVKSDQLPQASAKDLSVAKQATDALPSRWQFIFNNLAVAPQGKTQSASRMGMTEPLQYAWAVGAESQSLKIGLNLGKTLDQSGLEQSAKHYMFNMRRHCKGEFVAEADEQKITSRGIRWQVAEIVCAEKNRETLSALLFTSAHDEAATVVIQGDMKDAARIIRFRNNVLELMNR